jgi:hypothetical protein
MTAADITGLIGALGFPIFLVVAMLFIFVKYIWPWFVADQKLRRETESKRHSDHLVSFDRSSIAAELLAKVFIEFSTKASEQHEQQTTLAATHQGVLLNVIQGNHTDVVRRLDKIDSKLPNGFGKQRG